MKCILYITAFLGVHGALGAAEAATASTGKLVPQDAAGLVWKSAAGRAVSVKAPQLTLEDARDNAP